ncbi:MAG: hypothetical protein U9P44_03995 [archaeon]|nr:hypothetical protein [archaeon]
MSEMFDIIKKDIKILSEKTEDSKIRHIIRKLNRKTVEKVLDKE